jgi:hypothetical protein
MCITRRLLDYAGLDGLGLEVSSFVEYDPSAGGDGDDSSQHLGTAGWFAGVREGRCLFGINVSELDQPEALCGVMAHEVAHAYRQARELRADDRDVEEKLTDLTTVYLGLGVLTCNNTRRADLVRDARGAGIVRSGAGYLSVEAMCFLLAAQTVVRGYGGADVERVAKFLGSAQALCFRRAHRELDRDRGALLERLGVSQEVAATRPRPLPAFRPPSGERAAGPGVPWGRYVYRAAHPRRGAWFLRGLLAGVALTAAGRGLGAERGVGALIPLLALAGLAWGAAHPRYACSAPACGASLPPNADECQWCRGLVLGELREPPLTFATGECRRHRIYRLRGDRAWRYALTTLALAGFAGFALVPAGLPGEAYFGVILLGAAVAWFVGRGRRRDVCSAGGCDTVLEPFLRECPRCLGEICGDVVKKGRYESAEEAARREAAGAPRAP